VLFGVLQVVYQVGREAALACPNVLGLMYGVTAGLWGGLPDRTQLVRNKRGMCCELGGRAVVVAQYVYPIMLNDAEHQSPQHMHTNIVGSPLGKEPAVF
jgi:hypothetical protein